jgi:hypothetical protein
MWVSMIGIAVPCAAACCGTAATAVAATPHTKSLRVIIVIDACPAVARRAKAEQDTSGWIKCQHSTGPYRREFKNLVDLSRPNWTRRVKLDLNRRNKC